MVNCIIVDDEPLARQILEGHIGKTEGFRLITTCANALEAFDILNREQVDLMFLDIKMPSETASVFINVP